MSSTRMYLRGVGQADCTWKTPEGSTNMYLYFHGYRVESIDNNPFIWIGDPMDPGFIEPSIPVQNRGSCSHTSSYCEGSRPEGFYRFGKSTARVETHGGGTRQQITIIAPTPASVRNIYSRIRCSALKPKENWGKGGLMKPEVTQS